LIAKDNSLSYTFDIDGKHLKTLDTQTDKVLTTFEYDSNGTVTAIKAPNGQVTNLTIDGNGNLTTVNYTDNGMTKTVQSCGIESLTHYTLDQKTSDEVIKDQTLKLPSGKTLTTSIERVYAFNDDKTTKTLSINHKVLF
jgi:YD repeat-containing protein